MRHALVALALALLGFISVAPGTASAAGARAPHAVVASPRPAERDATSVAHNFAVPHPLPFLRGLHDNKQLANLIRENLRLHPEGTTKLDDAQCATSGSCASPEDWLASFRVHHPELTLATLAGYVDSLVAHRLTAEEAGEQWDMDCLEAMGNGQYRTIINCGNRQFHAGEVAYLDPTTNQFEMAHDCANPVRGRHHEPEEVVVSAPKCAEIDFETRPGDTAVRIAIFGPAVDESTCAPALMPAGEDNYITGWFDNCGTYYCNFEEVSQVLHMPVERRASYLTTTPGTHRIRVPLSFVGPNAVNRVVLCLDRGDTHSDGMGIQGTDYHREGALNVATVYYSSSDIPTGAPRLYWPWGEWNGR